MLTTVIDDQPVSIMLSFPQWLFAGYLRYHRFHVTRSSIVQIKQK
jgi:hypothetical protein